MKTIIYLDLDGVITNFHKAYKKIEPDLDVPNKFKKAVLEFEIFKDLEWMPNGRILYARLQDLMSSTVDIEILSSLGTMNQTVADEVAKQKTFWLNYHGIKFKTNFVKARSLKKNYAGPNTIIIDDMKDVIDGFKSAGSYGVHYSDQFVLSSVEEVQKLLKKMGMK